MQKIRVLIIEDNEVGRHLLQRLLAEHADVAVVGEAASIQDGFRLIAQQTPDLLLLDVELPDGNSFQLLERLMDPPAVIFITAHKDYAVKAFRTQALDYLLKPFSAEELAESLNRFRRREVRAVTPQAQPDRLLALARGAKVYFVPVAEIAAVLASREYTTVLDAQGRSFVEKRPLCHWVQSLPKDRFVQLDRSTLVNLRHIDHVVQNSPQKMALHLKTHTIPLTLGRAAIERLRHGCAEA